MLNASQPLGTIQGLDIPIARVTPIQTAVVEFSAGPGRDPYSLKADATMLRAAGLILVNRLQRGTRPTIVHVRRVLIQPASGRYIDKAQSDIVAEVWAGYKCMGRGERID